jgi:hypothetical protein
VKFESIVLLCTTVLHVNVMGKLSLNYPMFQRSALPRVLGNKYNGKILPKFISATKADLISKRKTIKGNLLKSNSSICFNKQCISRNVISK